MSEVLLLSTAATRRQPHDVMQPNQLGVSWPHRYSTVPLMVRRAARHGWTIRRDRFATTPNESGQSDHRIMAEGHELHVVAFWNRDGDTGRVALAAALVEGPVDDELFGGLEFALSLGPKARLDTRILAMVLGQLAPSSDPASGPLIESVSANGMFGMRSFSGFDTAHPLAAALRAEALLLWGIHHLAHDVANANGRTHTGGISVVGHLGHAATLVTHPHRTATTVAVREHAMALSRSPISHTAPVGAAQWSMHTAALLAAVDQIQAATRLRLPSADGTSIWADADVVAAWCTDIRGEIERCDTDHGVGSLVERLSLWAADRDPEASELVAAVLTELAADELDDTTADRLAVATDATFDLTFDPATPLHQLRHLLDERYAWLDNLLLVDRHASAMAWTLSPVGAAVARVPRAELTPRSVVAPVDVALQINHLRSVIADRPPDEPIGHTVGVHPSILTAAQRVLAPIGRYGEVHDNVCSSVHLPAELIRCSLATLGCTAFDVVSPDEVVGRLFVDDPQLENQP